MAKVLEEGTVDWRTTVRCSSCNSKIELTVDDFTRKRHILWDDYYTAKCPACEEDISVNPSTIPDHVRRKIKKSGFIF